MTITHDQQNFRVNIDEKVFDYLGFERIDVPPEESGQDAPFYFFTLELGEYLNLVSSANDEQENFYVRILECGDSIEVNYASDLRDLIQILKKVRNEKK